jgi:hypothetical protein
MKKRGTDYNMHKDFKGLGEFESVVSTKLKEYKKADPKMREEEKTSSNTTEEGAPDTIVNSSKKMYDTIVSEIAEFR